MQFSETELPGVWSIDPTPRTDQRGRFMRAWCRREFSEHGIDFEPVQANMGWSVRAGTVRGLHYQAAPHLEAKLIRCTRGAVFDVVVDLRPGSATFGRWFGTELTPENGRMVYVPPLCAHGYQSMQDGSEIYYLTSAEYAPDAVRGLAWDDPRVGVRWPLPASALSDQDRQWPRLEEPS